MKLNKNYGLNKPVTSQLSNGGDFKFVSMIQHELQPFKSKLKLYKNRI